MSDRIDIHALIHVALTTHYLRMCNYHYGIT